MLNKISFMLIGGILAQSVHFLAIPFIAQMYGPEAFGQYSQFFALYQIILPISALCLPLAIVLPKQDKTARYIAFTCVAVGFGIGILIALCPLIFGPVIENNGFGIYSLLALLPLFAAIQQSGYQWLMRRGRLLVLAVLAFSNAVLINAGRILFGLIFGATHLALAAGTFVGFACLAVVSFGLAYPPNAWLHLSNTNIRRVLAVIKEHRQFILFRTPQTLIGTLGRNMTILYLSVFIGNEATGHFALAVAVLGAGVLLLGNSVSSIFYPQISTLIVNGQRARIPLVWTTIGIWLCGFTIFLPIVFWGPYLFAWVFGEVWRPAGVFAQWMVPWFLFWLASRPPLDTLPALGRQKWLLGHEITCLAARALLLTTCYLLEITLINTIVYISITNSLLYLYVIMNTIKHTY